MRLMLNYSQMIIYVATGMRCKCLSLHSIFCYWAPGALRAPRVQSGSLHMGNQCTSMHIALNVIEPLTTPPVLSHACSIMLS